MAADVTYGKSAAFAGAAPEEIRAQVERITSDALFAGAERLCRFLRFTVGSALEGNGEHIKEYVIGREVFDRGEDYDTRLDPIVRVEARRLRSRLTEYYAGAGRYEPFRLEYPKGGYLPVVVPGVPAGSVQPVAAGRVHRPQVWWVAGVAAFALVLATALGVWRAGRQPAEIVAAPIPISWIEPNDATLDRVDVALAEDLTADLANSGAGVIAWPEIVRKKSLRLLGLSDFALQLGANRLLVVVVRSLGPSRVVRVFVIDEPSGRKRLALNYDRPPMGTFEEQNALAARITRDLRRSKAASW